MEILIAVIVVQIALAVLTSFALPWRSSWRRGSAWRWRSLVPCFAIGAGERSSVQAGAHVHDAVALSPVGIETLCPFCLKGTGPVGHEDICQDHRATDRHHHG